MHLRSIQARSSVGERHLDVVDVGGSIPPAPTRYEAEGMSSIAGVNTLAFVFRTLQIVLLFFKRNNLSKGSYPAQLG